MTLNCAEERRINGLSDKARNAIKYLYNHHAGIKLSQRASKGAKALFNIIVRAP